MLVNLIPHCFISPLTSIAALYKTNHFTAWRPRRYDKDFHISFPINQLQCHHSRTLALLAHISLTRKSSQAFATCPIAPSCLNQSRWTKIFFLNLTGALLRYSSTTALSLSYLPNKCRRCKRAFNTKTYKRTSYPCHQHSQPPQMQQSHLQT